ncbi:MAG: AhpC/TSA family protein [Chitinophagaceae bacterium]|nr:AhpC/TSA family protein [Chitinophagaceae bacterium]
MKQCMLLTAAFIFVIGLSAQEKPEGLFINSKAPDFKATDQNGNSIRLKEMVKKGNVILFFYRGNWCPYCSRQLKQMQDSLELLTAKGVQVLAITPEKIDGISKTIEKSSASFPIIHDEEGKIMKAYDVHFAVDEKLVNRYKMSGIDLEAINGKNGTNLPIPAVYIINKENTIVYRYFNEDYKKRVSVKELLLQL